ncbi:hypothetical protein TCAL_15616 [Tigriopus californicus]|uniref:Uncharacterized protein n=1 Tax=Tigriopus californicus TaxID=6832 RepID=A0A553PAE3_TIGCA|nr:hypothetical protein TCAL_15616 [Tigriopus californicus]
MAAIPLVLLISMNSLLYKLLQSQKLLNKAQLNRRVKRDQTVAGMFIAIVMVFIVCHTPKIVCSIYELCKIELAQDLALVGHQSQTLTRMITKALMKLAPLEIWGANLLDLKK